MPYLRDCFISKNILALPLIIFPLVVGGDSSQGVAVHLLTAEEGNALDPYFKWYECWSPVLGADSTAIRPSIP